MPQAWCLLATLSFGLVWAGEQATAPSYSAASIVNSASNTAGALAPNGLATIYGANLSWETRAVAGSDIVAGTLPTELAGVRVFMDGMPVHLYYVSPTQINFLIPSNLVEGDYQIWVFRDGITGKKATVKLVDAAPGLFVMATEDVIATHADGSLITPDQPAAPAEIIVVYAAGLGYTDPEMVPGRVAMMAARIRRRTDLRIRLSGQLIDDSQVFYAGVTPGSAGLYQINFQLPDNAPDESEIQISVGDQTSAVLKLRVARAAAN